FAQSYIDAYVKPAPEEKAPAAAEATAKPEAATPVEAKAAPSGDSKPAESSAPAARVEGRQGRRGSGDAASSAPAKLAKGAAAPDFAVADERGTVQKLADYRGRMVLVWFYPKADTPGCTAEGCGLRDQIEEFRRRDVAVLGVSFDSREDNAAFRTKHELPFPLLSDSDRAMAIAYGAAENAEAKVARRIAVLIDGEGKVVQYWGRVDPRTFAATAVAALPL
ncbi:MAG: peroxiredoxin, partial [Planctomycetes bacterium]|nr:peroxiredoxin [Planctomycetota bacterium]